MKSNSDLRLILISLEDSELFLHVAVYTASWNAQFRECCRGHGVCRAASAALYLREGFKAL